MSTHVLARLSAQRRWVRSSCVADMAHRPAFARHTLESDFFDALTLVRRGL